jgi:hypothetical protein
MPNLTLPDFAAGLPATQVDASLRQALGACDLTHECAVLWFAEVQRRGLYRQLGHTSLQLYATQALGFTDNRYYQFKRLTDDLDRLARFESLVEVAHKMGRAPADGRPRRTNHRPAMSRLCTRRCHNQPRREAHCAGRYRKSRPNLVAWDLFQTQTTDYKEADS